MPKERNFKPQLTLQDRLAARAGKVREQAAPLKPGPEKDALLKRARQADVATQVESWANSPGLRPPK